MNLSVRVSDVFQKECVQSFVFYFLQEGNETILKCSILPLFYFSSSMNAKITQLVWTHPLIVPANFYDILAAPSRGSGSLLPSLLDNHSLLKLGVKPGPVHAVPATSNLLQHAATDLAEKFRELSEAASSGRMVDTHAAAAVKMYSSDMDSSLRHAAADEDKAVQNNGGSVEAALQRENDEISKKNELLKVRDEMELKLVETVEKYKSKKANIESLGQEIDVLTRKRNDLLQKVEKSKEEFEKHQKVLQLLPNAEENLAKLVAIVQKSRAKLEDLKLQWEGHKEKLDMEYNEATLRTSQLEKVSAEKKIKGPTMLDRINQIQADIKEKEAVYKSLSKAFQLLKSDGQPREFYTNRILDLVKQIEKLR